MEIKDIFTLIAI